MGSGRGLWGLGQAASAWECAWLAGLFNCVLLMKRSFGHLRYPSPGLRLCVVVPGVSPQMNILSVPQGPPECRSEILGPRNATNDPVSWPESRKTNVDSFAEVSTFAETTDFPTAGNECPWPFSLLPTQAWPGPGGLDVGLYSERLASSTASVPNTAPAALHIPTPKSTLTAKAHPQFTDEETET